MNCVVQLHVGPGRWSTYSLGLRIDAFYRYGHEFHRVAIKTGSPLVRYYLIGHALELFLKAYLFHRGMTASTLKKRDFGHNLKRLLDECVRCRLTDHFRVSLRLQSDIAVFTDIYASKKLEYFSLLDVFVPPRLPHMLRLCRFVALLDRELLGIIASGT